MYDECNHDNVYGIATKYSALMIPNCPGAVFDLWQNDNMAGILDHFMAEKSV